MSLIFTQLRSPCKNVWHVHSTTESLKQTEATSVTDKVTQKYTRIRLLESADCLLTFFSSDSQRSCKVSPSPESNVCWKARMLCCLFHLHRPDSIIPNISSKRDAGTFRYFQGGTRAYPTLSECTDMWFSLLEACHRYFPLKRNRNTNAEDCVHKQDLSPPLSPNE